MTEKDLYVKAGIDEALKDPQIALSGNWVISDTDEAQDMLLMGEVGGSCQSLTFDANKSICLLSYIMDGKNRQIAVKDEEGSIIGRCVIRILWDKNFKKPVLFQEKLYVNNNNQYVKALIKAMCLDRAKSLGLVLLEKDNYSSSQELIRYSNSIESLDGFSYEYVDALEGVTSSPYIISGAKVIYSPIE